VIDRFVVVLRVRPVVASSSSSIVRQSSRSMSSRRSRAGSLASASRARARDRPRARAPALARTSFSRASASPCVDARSLERSPSFALRRSSPHTATRVARPRSAPRPFARAVFASPSRAVSPLERGRRRRGARIHRARGARDDGGHDARDAGLALGARFTDRAGAAIDARLLRASRTARGRRRARSRGARARANGEARAGLGRGWDARETRDARETGD